MKIKRPTTTTLIVEALKSADDFMSKAMLRQATREPPNRIGAALFHLRKHRVIDCVIEPDGTSWWFLTNDDDRQRTVAEILASIKKRRRRSPRKQQT